MGSFACLVLAVLGSWPATFEKPFEVPSLPYFERASLEAKSGEVNEYRPCATGAAAATAAERVYAFDLDQPARLTAWLEFPESESAALYVLSDPSHRDGVADSCVAGGEALVEVDLSAGRHYLAVDGPDASSPTLRAYAIGAGWFEFPLAAGVTWRATRTDGIGGGQQVIHLLEVDPAVEGVRIEPVINPNNQCRTVPDTVASLPEQPVAAVNPWFFYHSESAPCQAGNLVKKDGEVLARHDWNGAPHGALGWSPGGTPRAAFVAQPGHYPYSWSAIYPVEEPTWDEVDNAIGGIPLLVREGIARQGAEEWALENLSSAGFFGINPRTFMSYDSDGRFVLGTFDGRRSNARGISLDDLAAWAASELGAMGAVNLDGGGSTTLWIGKMTPSGVVNYPSDAGAAEFADHRGSRLVGGAIVVYAEPYAHPPRFLSEPPRKAAVGEQYRYAPTVVDLNLDDLHAFQLIEGPVEMDIDAATGELELVSECSGIVQVTLRVEDSFGASAEQSFALSIAGQAPACNVENDDEDDLDSESQPRSESSGCSATNTSGKERAWWALVAMVLLLRSAPVYRRRWR